MSKRDANSILKNEGSEALGRALDDSHAEGVKKAKIVSIRSRSKTYWPDPPDPDMSIIDGARIAPPQIDVSLFGSLAPILKTIAAHKGAPIDAAALALLVSASALIGVKRRVRPWPGWTEPSMLWGGLVMPPSQNKSPVLAPFREAVQIAEDYLSRDFDDRHRTWEAGKKEAQLTREKWEKDVKEAFEKGYLPPPLPETAEEPPEPLKPRLWVGDITTEKAAELLANRPGGILIYRDELAGWFTSMGRYSGGSGADRAFWLETYNGDRFRYDRKSSGEIDVPHAAAAILGGIQPDRVKDLALEGQRDGLPARFIWIYPDPVPPVRPKGDFEIARLNRIFERLATLQARNEIDGSFRPVDLPLTPQGEAFFHTWRVEHYEVIRAASGLYADALGKYGGNLLRIACVLEHLTWAASDHNAPPEIISDASIKAAMTLLDKWAKPHLARVVGEAGSPRVDTNAGTLARFILCNPCEKFNASIVRRNQKLPGLEAGPEMDAACEELIEASWIRFVGTRQGTRKGRTSKDFEVNPKVYPPTISSNSADRRKPQ